MIKTDSENVPPQCFKEPSNSQRVRKLRKFKDLVKIRDQASSHPQDFFAQAASNPSNQDIEQFDPRILKTADLNEKLKIIQETISLALPQERLLILFQILRTESVHPIMREFLCQFLIRKYPQVFSFILQALIPDQELPILLEGTWLLINLSGAQPSELKIDLAHQEAFLSCLVDLVSHPNLNVRHQAIWATTNILSEARLEPLRIHFIDNTPMIENVIELLDEDDPPVYRITTALWSLETLFALFQELDFKEKGKVTLVMKTALDFSFYPKKSISLSAIRIITLLIELNPKSHSEVFRRLGGIELWIPDILSPQSKVDWRAALKLMGLLLESGTLKIQKILIKEHKIPVMVEDELNMIQGEIMQLGWDYDFNKKLAEMCLFLLARVPSEQDYILDNFLQYSLGYAFFFMDSRDPHIRFQSSKMLHNFLRSCGTSQLELVDITQTMERLISQLSCVDSALVLQSIYSIQILLEYGASLVVDSVAESNFVWNIFQFVGGLVSWHNLMLSPNQEIAKIAEETFEKYAPLMGQIDERLDSEYERLFDIQTEEQKEPKVEGAPSVIEEDKEGEEELEGEADRMLQQKEDKALQQLPRKYGFNTTDLGFGQSKSEVSHPIPRNSLPLPKLSSKPDLEQHSDGNKNIESEEEGFNRSDEKKEGVEQEESEVDI